MSPEEFKTTATAIYEAAQKLGMVELTVAVERALMMECNGLVDRCECNGNGLVPIPYDGTPERDAEVCGRLYTFVHSAAYRATNHSSLDVDSPYITFVGFASALQTSDLPAALTALRALVEAVK